MARAAVVIVVFAIVLSGCMGSSPKKESEASSDPRETGRTSKGTRYADTVEPELLPERIHFGQLPNMHAAPPTQANPVAVPIYLKRDPTDMAFSWNWTLQNDSVIEGGQYELWFRVKQPTFHSTVAHSAGPAYICGGNVHLRFGGQDMFAGCILFPSGPLMPGDHKTASTFALERPLNARAGDTVHIRLMVSATSSESSPSLELLTYSTKYSSWIDLLTAPPN